MSRSRKKTPRGGITTARSEKFDKRIANRRLRTTNKKILATGSDELKDMREVSNIWDFAKDGKRYFNPKHPRNKKCLRK